MLCQTVVNSSEENAVKKKTPEADSFANANASPPLVTFGAGGNSSTWHLVQSHSRDIKLTYYTVVLPHLRCRKATTTVKVKFYHQTRFKFDKKFEIFAKILNTGYANYFRTKTFKFNQKLYKI